MLKDVIKTKIDEYLGFDSDKLFENNNIFDHKGKFKKLARIFGGALRDIIADDKINDIDILVGARTMDVCHDIITNQGYYYKDNLITKGVNSIYIELNIVCEPRTYIKDDKIIQLIKPAADNKLLYSNPLPGGITEKEYKEVFVKLIKNVDLSCCGISYDGNVYENCPYAIQHCKNKIFTINSLALMNNPRRINSRIRKLEERGWKSSNLGILREAKIDEIFSDDEFILEY